MRRHSAVFADRRFCLSAQHATLDVRHGVAVVAHHPVHAEDLSVACAAPARVVRIDQAHFRLF